MPVSALSFDLMGQAHTRGGFDATAVGLVSGAAVYTATNWYLAHHGAEHRKRSGGQQPSESEKQPSQQAKGGEPREQRVAA